MPFLVSSTSFIVTIKETSLGYVLAFNELTYGAGQVNGILLVKPLQVFAVLAAIYFLLCYSMSVVAKRIKRTLSLKARAVT